MAKKKYVTYEFHNIKKKRIEQNTKVLMLGNGKRIVFKSKRIANAYIADTNRFLTKCLVTLNVAYADLFREYRIVWFTVTNFGCGPASNARNEMQTVRDHLHDLKDSYCIPVNTLSPSPLTPSNLPPSILR